ncbi:hypothetical protein RJ639_010717 [Escallonia herrerae]|uniref:Pentatricopeptide repeat-containing protein n=1 Tax=Escallonia herrerae TaxID=1293975 RepID=A0AA88VL83_9ASTE|nr:hypothetical protein RJ639_010717 [Escallonia herrerae]
MYRSRVDVLYHFPLCFVQSLLHAFGRGPILSLLHLSVHYADVELAMAMHAAILRQLEDTHLSNSLIAAYLKLGRPSYARKVFDEMSRRDVVSYTALISGFAKLAREDEAVGLFFEMRASVHALATKMGYLSCTYVSNVLMEFYGKCACLSIMLKLFDKMPQRGIASWNTVASCLVKELMYERALVRVHDMLQTDNFRVDYFTLSILLVASAGCFASMAGRELHAHALRSGFETNLSVKNALIGFYRKCGNVKNVVVLFERMPVKDVITWTEMVTTYMEFGLVESAVEFLYRMPVKNCVSYNALLAGYCQNGEVSRSLGLFCKMVEEGIELSDFTLTSVVYACGLLMETKTSEQIHGFVLKFGFGSNDCIETALLYMCTRCGRMADAEKMFHRWPSDQNNSIIWTSIICGYARHGQPDKAISLFCLGQAEGTMTLDEVASAARSLRGRDLLCACKEMTKMRCEHLLELLNPFPWKRDYKDYLNGIPLSDAL